MTIQMFQKLGYASYNEFDVETFSCEKDDQFVSFVEVDRSSEVPKNEFHCDDQKPHEKR